jgi:hypothetical protein
MKPTTDEARRTRGARDRRPNVPEEPERRERGTRAPDKDDCRCAITRAGRSAGMPSGGPVRTTIHRTEPLRRSFASPVRPPRAPLARSERSESDEPRNRGGADRRPCRPPEGVGRDRSRRDRRACNGGPTAAPPGRPRPGGPGLFDRHRRDDRSRARRRSHRRRRNSFGRGEDRAVRTDRLPGRAHRGRQALRPPAEPRRRQVRGPRCGDRRRRRGPTRIDAGYAARGRAARRRVGPEGRTGPAPAASGPPGLRSHQTRRRGGGTERGATGQPDQAEERSVRCVSHDRGTCGGGRTHPRPPVESEPDRPSGRTAQA